nr:diguanylate cyclase [Oceanococcus sp. HetDA_MAG_MS8]
MHNVNQLNRLRRAADPVPELAGFDAESGLAVRELLMERVEQQWEKCARTKQPLGALLLALDGVDRDNLDKQHTEVLCADVREAGQVVSRWCRRRADFAGRMRKQEIGVMLAESKLEGMRGVAEQIIRNIHALQLPHPIDSQATLTVSVGGAVVIPDKNHMASSLWVFADRALADARAMHGNCAVFYGDDVPVPH